MAAEAQLSAEIGVMVIACRLPGGQLNTHLGATVLLAAAQLIALGTREQLQALITLATGAA